MMESSGGVTIQRGGYSYEGLAVTCRSNSISKKLDGFANQANWNGQTHRVLQ